MSSEDIDQLQAQEPLDIIPLSEQELRTVLGLGPDVDMACFPTDTDLADDARIMASFEAEPEPTDPDRPLRQDQRFADLEEYRERAK